MKHISFIYFFFIFRKFIYKLIVEKPKRVYLLINLSEEILHLFLYSGYLSKKFYSSLNY
jgi:hypothetical protein